MGQLSRATALPSVVIGGRTILNPENLIWLVAHTNSGANLNATYRKMGASSGYAVPASKTFRVLAIRHSDAASSGILGLNNPVLYSDNDVGYGTSTAFTNPVYPGGSSNSALAGSYGSFGAVREVSLQFDIPTGKYVSCVGNATAAEEVVLVGYEY